LERGAVPVEDLGNFLRRCAEPEPRKKACHDRRNLTQSPGRGNEQDVLAEREEHGFTVLRRGSGFV
jgi:hypothetical protein